ncbi:MAG TPA: adenylate/guanylate cyclase domain-containing protein [Candidatus Limnocylindrales bacterium]|nr:adenylate/guanylate cyclase domain-containing protein [Candidatus Limnocylindrales bacterium]
MTEVTSPASSSPADPLEAGRAALASHDWTSAFELLSRADAERPLGGRDLESLATAAFFAARADAGIAAKERAFRVWLDDGDPIRAAAVGLDVAREYAFLGKMSIAAGWIRRAERLIGEGDTYAHGYLALMRAEMAAGSGDPDTALREAQRAVEIGERSTDGDLRAFAQGALGQLKIATGDIDDGFALLEEAALAAVSGDISPLASGATACRMIATCRDLTDYRRATEWIEATERYCAKQAVSGFPGVCRIHRAEVSAVRGAWDQAETELVRATAELGGYNVTPIQAEGYYAIGDVRRMKGDHAGAEAALRDAHALGKSPQPALALIRLAEGKVKAASSAIDAALAETWDKWTRARLLPAQVEIAIAAGDVDRARAAAAEHAEIIAVRPSPALNAIHAVTEARLAFVDRDPARANRELRAAIREWRDVGAPYEIARARAMLARALRELDDEEGADLELRAALDEFRRLGAAPDADAADRELRAAEERRSGPVHVRKTFVFTDIVGSTHLAEALGDEAWERLLRWHDDMLRAIAAQAGGEVVNSTGDGFFLAFDSARTALDGAIAIQRALRDHRRSSGFAPPVRIGIHTADANRRGADYSGVGVHVAARVVALAEGGEIIATAETLEAAGDATGPDVRETTVKGVSAPVRVVPVAWS